MEDLGERLTGATAIGVLGVALTAMFLGYDWFWMVFVIGYAVVLPLVAILTGADGEEAGADWQPETDGADADVEADVGTAEPTSKQDALELLRERYARGELSDEQFDRKLDRLLGTESLEDAREAVRESADRRADDRERAGGRESTDDREPATERE